MTVVMLFRYPLLWAAIAAFLIGMLIAMRFTSEIAWTGFDFLVAGGLLGGAAAAFELASRITRAGLPRAAIGAVLVVFVLVIWADGAVGIF